MQRKIISGVLALILAVIPYSAFAKTIDEMSFEELLTWRERITQELFSRPEWQSVTVPPGVYQVGRDIPAGTWTVKCSEDNSTNIFMSECDFSWGEYLDDNGQDIAWDGRWDYVTIYNPSSEYYDGGSTEYTFTCKEGDWIVIDISYAAAVFTTYIGKPNLGFK